MLFTYIGKYIAVRYIKKLTEKVTDKYAVAHEFIKAHKGMTGKRLKSHGQ